MIKKRKDEVKRREHRAILYLDNRGDDCVLSIHGFQTKQQHHIGSLLVVYRSLTQGTPFTSAVRLLLCLSHPSTHFIIVPAGEKELPKLLRFETDTESLSHDAFGQIKPSLLHYWNQIAAVTITAFYCYWLWCIISHELWGQGKIINLTACQYLYTSAHYSVWTAARPHQGSLLTIPWWITLLCFNAPLLLS